MQITEVNTHTGEVVAIRSLADTGQRLLDTRFATTKGTLQSALVQARRSRLTIPHAWFRPQREGDERKLAKEAEGQLVERVEV